MLDKKGGHFKFVMDASLGVSSQDIKDLCRCFGLGGLVRYDIEKDIKFSHCHPIVFIETSTGGFVLKFHTHTSPADHRDEFRLHAALRQGGLSVPRMRLSRRKEASVRVRSWRVTCCEWIKDALPLYRHFPQGKDLESFNRQTLIFRDVLSGCVRRGMRFPSESLKYDIGRIKAMLSACPQTPSLRRLKDVLRILYRHPVGKRLPRLSALHGDFSPANVLIKNEQCIFLDMTHVTMNYPGADIASMVLGLLGHSLSFVCFSYINSCRDTGLLDEHGMPLFSFMVRWRAAKKALRSHYSLLCFDGKAKNRREKEFKSRLLFHRELYLSTARGEFLGTNW